MSMLYEEKSWNELLEEATRTLQQLRRGPMSFGRFQTGRLAIEWTVRSGSIVVADDCAGDQLGEILAPQETSIPPTHA
jgi:hypothetical protein